MLKFLLLIVLLFFALGLAAIVMKRLASISAPANSGRAAPAAIWRRYAPAASMGGCDCALLVAGNLRGWAAFGKLDAIIQPARPRS